MPQYSDTLEDPVQLSMDDDAALLDRFGRESGRRWTVDSARLANQILTTANQQAAEIRREVRGQAAVSLENAKQEAAELVRRAAAEAEAKIAAAEQQAAEIRAAVMKLSTDLADTATYVTKPETPAAAPALKPGVSPRRIRRESPAAATPRNRKLSAARKVTAAFVILALTGVGTGSTELVLHGGRFFIFRSNGAGATVTGPSEDQGPGQPDAPGAHR